MAEQEQKSAQESPQQQMEAVEAEIVESKFVKRWKTVHSFLLDEPHYISRFTSYVESDMGIKKNSALMAIEVIISLALIFSEDRHQQVISTCITVAYPMYNSFMLLVSQKNDESTKILLLYWIIYACFEPLVSLARVNCMIRTCAKRVVIFRKFTRRYCRCIGLGKQCFSCTCIYLRRTVSAKSGTWH